ncbi:MAG: DUF3052 domain-containing protein [Acidobacteriota bacterium]|nr:DUF3052 domain-containing protein [Acidobacteriota bacterium]
MGQEAKCRVEFEGKSSLGKALLETSELIFRGDFRLKILHRAISAMEARDGRLDVVFDGGRAVFYLGDAAEKWAARIRNPPSHLDKLGVKPGMRVRLMGRFDPAFTEEIKNRGALVVRAKADLTFLAAGTKDQLLELAYLTEGPVWILYPKGVKTITESEVLAAGRAAGMVDTKVVGFSTELTGLKFVPRRA